VKKIFFVLTLLLVGRMASADYLIQLTDGTATVWESYYVKDTRYCTQKDIGEVCWAKADVKYIKKVPAGTVVSEYGFSTGISDENAESRKQANSAAVSSVVNEMEQHRAKRDAEMARKEAERAKRVRRLGEDQVIKEERSGNSVR